MADQVFSLIRKMVGKDDVLVFYEPSGVMSLFVDGFVPAMLSLL